MMESQFTGIPKFSWQEKRYKSIYTTTAQGPNPSGNLLGPFAIAGTSGPIGNSNAYFAPAAFSSVRIYVTDASYFQVDDSVKMFGVPTDATGPTSSAGTTIDLAGRVNAVNNQSTPYWIEMAVTLAYDGTNGMVNQPLNIALANGLNVLKIGTMYAEGARSRTGIYKTPYEIYNNTQIFKTPWEMTRTAMKEPLIYDKTGEYRDASKEAGIDHLADLEFAMFFGERNNTTAVDPETGQTVSRRSMGGLRWFLDNFEIGTDYGLPNIAGSSDYIDNYFKRVIKLGGNTIQKGNFDILMGRLFERTNSTTFEKVCFCGPDYLNKLSAAYENRTAVINLRENGFKGWDFELIKHNTNAGTVYYKQHPLFVNFPNMRNSAFYVDLGYIGYRPLLDSDTDIMPMIQPRDADRRKDQWLTECGLEIRFPEAFMYVENLGGITL